MWRAALRRFLTLLVVLGGITATLSVLAGLLGGGSVDRALAVGFYLVGSFMLIAGFFIGNRGPVRPKGSGTPFFGQRMMRWATPLEREESLNESALYVVLGFALILIGVAADSRANLF
jgi:sulfite exporter TauE/SafE